MPTQLTAEEIKRRILEYAALQAMGIKPQRTDALDEQNQHSLHLRLSGITSGITADSKPFNRNTIQPRELNDAEFLKATYHLADDAFLEKVYWTYLQRASDLDGKTFYLKLLADGMLRQGVLNSIRESDEFQSKQT
jgi:hypothetical protein